MLPQQTETCQYVTHTTLSLYYSSPCPLSCVANDRSIDWTINRQEAYCKTNACLGPSLLQMVTLKRLPFNLPRSFSPVNWHNRAQIFDHIRIDIFRIFVHIKAVKYLLSQMVDVHAKDRFTRCDFVRHSFMPLTKIAPLWLSTGWFSSQYCWCPYFHQYISNVSLQYFHPWYIGEFWPAFISAMLFDLFQLNFHQHRVDSELT